LPGLGVIEDGVIAAAGGRIVYAGPAADAPRRSKQKPSMIATAAGSRPG
jgi:imidazolonepropionase-like amidohydrolase